MKLLYTVIVAAILLVKGYEAKPPGGKGGNPLALGAKKGRHHDRGPCEKKTPLSASTIEFIQSLPQEERQEYRRLMQEIECLNDAVAQDDGGANEEIASKKGMKAKQKLGNRGNKTHVHDPIEDNEGDFLQEGDIALSLQELQQLMENYNVHTEGATSGSRKKRKVDARQPRWPDYSAIPFVIDDASYEAGESFRSSIEAVHDFYEANTCLRFVEVDPSVYHMKYYNGTGCWSYIGYLGLYSTYISKGYQDVSLKTNCDYGRTIFHETGHALGLRHEQSRTDRDYYVSIDFSKITESKASNYAMMSSMEDYGDKYDYGSSMHYGPTYFSNTTGADGSREDVMTALDPRSQDNMASQIPSFVDIYQINAHYCSEVCSTAITCLNNGYQDPNDCTKCKCPMSFGGDFCDEVATSNPSGCGSLARIPATTEWQNLAGAGTKGEECHWQIESPENSQIEINFPADNEIARFYCSDGCIWGFVEIKTGVEAGNPAQSDPNWAISGYRYCCTSLVDVGGFTSMVNLTTVSLVFPAWPTQTRAANFKLQYRYVSEPTTESPTTEAPTTESPTTEAPTTESPTTEAPTTESPTTEAPTTKAPTTEAPTTEAPTTEAPTTESPTTEPPPTAAPTTESPTTEPPPTAAPTTESPEGGACGFTEWEEWQGECCGGCPRYRFRECVEVNGCECAQDYSEYYSLQMCSGTDGKCIINLRGVQKCRAFYSSSCGENRVFEASSDFCCNTHRLNRRRNYCIPK